MKRYMDLDEAVFIAVFVIIIAVVLGAMLTELFV